jgi:4,5-dihydroxyphthalate decarboxylase
VRSLSPKTRLKLSFASLDYLDRTRALSEGTVQPEGVELACVRFGPYQLFQKVAQGDEFDIAEMSASTFMALAAREDERYVAIPVFLSRRFRHGDIFIHGASDISRPEDLVGRKVGVPDYEMTAALWQRAFLQHDFGVTPDQMQWYQGGEFSPGFVQRVELKLPSGVRVGVIPEDRTLHDMVATGEIDAVLCPHIPAGLSDGSGRVRRLFPDYAEVEHAYYERTKFFPIMHLTVVRRALYEAHPWVAVSLTKAFVEAQALGWRRMNEFGALAVMVPWLMRDIEEINALMGPAFWPYGFKENYEILNEMCEYSSEQGISARRLTPEELFVPETHDLILDQGGPGD